VRGFVFPSHPPERILERKLQPKLHDAGAARSEDGVAIDDVRCAAAAAERMGDRGIVADVGAHHAAIRIGEVGMIEDVPTSTTTFCRSKISNQNLKSKISHCRCRLFAQGFQAMSMMSGLGAQF
jgi:hypothetical protein